MGYLDEIIRRNGLTVVEIGAVCYIRSVMGNDWAPTFEELREVFGEDWRRLVQSLRERGVVHAEFRPRTVWLRVVAAGDGKRDRSRAAGRARRRRDFGK